MRGIEMCRTPRVSRIAIAIAVICLISMPLAGQTPRSLAGRSDVVSCQRILRRQFSQQLTLVPTQSVGTRMALQMRRPEAPI